MTQIKEEEVLDQRAQERQTSSPLAARINAARPARVRQPSSRAGSLLSHFRRMHLLNYIVLTVGAVAMVVPFIWMLSTSFKPQGETVTFPPSLLPKHFTLDNYLDVFRRANMGRLYLNTFYVATVKTGVMVYTSTLLGYIFGKFHFRGREILFYLFLATWIIPFEVYMIPLYVMMVGAGLGNTYTALIIPYIYSAYAMFLFRQFMFTIPNDFIDAARIDGAGEWYIFHRIILPLARPALGTLIAFYFMWMWNDFTWPLIVLTESSKYVLPLGLAVFVSEFQSQHGIIMAGASLAIVPVLVVFIAMQRHIVQGVTLSGLK
jgi:multiple sugar transport system permease protein